MSKIPKYKQYVENINLTIKEIKSHGFAAPTLKGELRVRSETIVYQKGPKAGTIMPFEEAHAFFEKQGRNYTKNLYIKQVRSIEKTAAQRFTNYEQFYDSEKQRTISSLVDDLNYLGKDLNKEQTREMLSRFSLEELQDIFAESANKTEQDKYGRFTVYSVDEFGVKHYTQFSENLQQIIKEHLNSI